jgi:hypothetical protein
MKKQELFLSIGYESSPQSGTSILMQLFGNNATEAGFNESIIRQQFPHAESAIVRYSLMMDGVSIETFSPPEFVISNEPAQGQVKQKRCQILDLESFRERKLCRTQR